MSAKHASPRFSIVVPTYNRAKTLQRTLDSCFAQTYADFEVIVVDDGSSDGTLEALGTNTDPRLVVVPQQNAGPAAARNHGMRRARGSYIAFLDSDDLWYPEFLATAQAQLEAEPNVLLYGQIIVDRGVGRYWIKPDRPMADQESIYDFLYVHGGFIQTSTLIVPQSLAATVSWDESVTFGDNDQFAIDCWHTGIPFRMMPKALVLYADIVSPDALSQLPIYEGDSPKYTNFFRWMESQRAHMSQQARLGFEARFLSVGTARRQPLKSFKYLWTAWRAGAISASGVLRQMVQNYMPRAYRRLTDQYVRLRGQRLDAVEH